MHEIKRTPIHTIRHLLKNFPCVAIIGARQVGKTTFVKQVLPSSPIYDLEKRSDYERIKHDPDFFLSQQKTPIIIDESQVLPELFPAIRVAIDNDRKHNGRYLLTGSSSPVLINKITESLAGRIAIFELGGFSLEEQWEVNLSPLYEHINNRDFSKLEKLNSRFSNDQLFTSCFLGTYPEPFLKYRKDRTGFSIWMENYFQTYIKRDVRGLFPGLNINTYQRFISMLSSSSGQMLNFSEFARSLDVSQPTAKLYFDIAHGTFIWRMLQSYQKNVKKRVTKMPKGQMRDTGLLNYLLSIPSVDAFYSHPLVGRIWETFIIEQIIKGFTNLSIPFHLYYYRTSNKAEIDLVLEGDFGLIPIEIKLGTICSNKNLYALKSFIKDYDAKIGLVINNSSETAWLSKNILQIPAGCL